MSVKARMREAIELLRARGHEVTGLVADAVIGEDRFTQRTIPGGSEVVDGEGADSKPDPNPDLGAGSEPGTDFLIVDGVTFLEGVFVDAETPQDIMRIVEVGLRK